jgi:hypothetical protein
MFSSDKQFYEKLSQRGLTDQEAFEAKSNFVGFYDLLYRIDKRLKEQNNERDNRGANNSD